MNNKMLDKINLLDLKLDNKGRMAVMQIMILLVGVVGVVYGIGIISAADLPKTNWVMDFEGKKVFYYKNKNGALQQIGEIVDKAPNNIETSEFNELIKNGKLKTVTSKDFADAGYTSKITTAPIDVTANANKVYSQSLNSVSSLGADAQKAVTDAYTKAGGGANGAVAASKTAADLLNKADAAAPAAFWDGSASNWWSGLKQGAGWALGAYLAVQTLGNLAGLEKGKVNALSNAAAMTGFVAGTLDKLVVGEGFGAGATVWGSALVAGWIVFHSTYEETSYKVAKFKCKVWDAPDGGSQCEKCNQQGILPCSEYQCKSLGKSCELLNDEDTGRQLCVDTNVNDVTPPVITPNEDVLTEGYMYTPDNTVSPPARGVEIVDESDPTDAEGKCIAAFTPLTFGIMLDEPGMCKIDFRRSESFEDFDYDFGESYYDYNHTQTLNLPSAETAEKEGLTIYNDKDLNLYVKCKDGRGNVNEADFVFRFCVDPGPDTTAPLIVETSVFEGMPVSYGQDALNLTIFVNEPANCKWDLENKAYEDMGTLMTCAQRSSDSTAYNGQELYMCETELTGIKDEQENRFYFKCQDQPLEENEADRNTNTESQPKDGFMIMGTRPLYIDEVGPANETIRDSTEVVTVTLTAETSAGYNEGEAICRFRETDSGDEPVEFFNTNSYIHSTDLGLLEGEYDYDIICTDLGGNQDTAKVSFEVESDSEEPIVVRAYKETGYLKIVTDEASECVYDTTDCGYLFEDGMALTPGEENSHFTDWNTKTRFYIKCSDEYGNKPAPNRCSAIIRPID